MVGSESVVRKSVGGENTPELRGGAGGLEHGGEGSDLGRRSQTIGDGGDGSEKESGSEELGWCLRSPRRVLPPHPPDQSQSDALPSSALLLLTTVLGGRYCHRSAYEEKVGRCIICSGAQMAGEWGAQGPRAVRL